MSSRISARDIPAGRTLTLTGGTVSVTSAKTRLHPSAPHPAAMANILRIDFGMAAETLEGGGGAGKSPIRMCSCESNGSAVSGDRDVLADQVARAIGFVTGLAAQCRRDISIGG